MTVKHEATVYEGAVTHRRYKPAQHFLKYKVFSFLLDLDRLDETASKLRWFSRNKFNLYSFYDRDHTPEEPGDIADHVRRTLSDAGLNARGRILLLCYPRILGYVFNPLSVFYCYDGNDRLMAMIYEVRNTFGGKHSYLIPVERHDGKIEQSADKVFHVSPFIDMDMRYEFSLSEPDDAVRVTINTSDHEGLLLNANFQGRATEITDKKLRALFFRYPLMTLKVILGIHWEALKLILKGIHLRPGAPAPEQPVTVVKPVPAMRADAA